MRTERVWEASGIRYRVLEEQRVRIPARPLRRTRGPLLAAEPETILARLAPDRAAMGERILREGANGWRFWSTLRRKAGERFSPLVAETELLDQLVREAGLHVVDTYRNERWMAQRFVVDPSVREWLGILDPEALRQELIEELTHGDLRDAVVTGPPPGIPWSSFAFVLRCAERLLALREHGVQPGARELAGLVDHTKAWSPRRRDLLEKVLGQPFDELVSRRERQLAVRGPLRHAEGSLWASSVADVTIEVSEEARGVVLVENTETLGKLLPLADEGWIVVQIPGGPPPAEIQFVARLYELAPHLRFYAVFDLDPAGIRIARTLERQSGVTLDAGMMTPAFLEHSVARQPLNRWDVDELQRLVGHASGFEPLRAGLARRKYKVEQETMQRELLDSFLAVTRESATLARVPANSAHIHIESS